MPPIPSNLIYTRGFYAEKFGGIPRVLRRALDRWLRGYITSHSTDEGLGTIDSVNDDVGIW